MAARDRAHRLPGPRGLAEVRALRRIFADPIPVLDELRAEYGPLSQLGFGPARMVIAGDAAVIGELFALPTSTFRWGHKFNVLGFVVGPGSMIVSDGDDHTRRRGSVQAAFSRRRLNGWIPMIIDQTDLAIDRLLARTPPGATVDLYPVIRSMLLEVVVRAFFGDRFADRAQEIGALFQGPQDYLEAPAIKQMPHPIPGTRRARVRRDRLALDAIIDEAIADVRAHDAGDAFDVLEALVRDGRLNDDEIRDQVVTLIGAGYDTTTASLAWTIWCAVLDPGTWQRLRTEADMVFGPVDATGERPARDHELLNALHLANSVMHETLRLHPAGVISPREAARDIVLSDGSCIRKGTLVLWSAHLAGRDPNAWPDPLTFDPSRFAELTTNQRRLADESWMPFGGGARNCIGFALAQMELTLMIARLAQRLDLEAAPGATIPKPVGMVVNRPTGGVPMRVSAADATAAVA